MTKHMRAGLFGALALVTLFSSAFAEEVRFIERDARAFVLQTGGYTISYDPFSEKKGWIHILRTGTKDGIATKLAVGQHLDVTDPGSGEGSIYNWQENRKDNDMFRSLVCEETSDTLEVRIASERQWASFDSQIRAYKEYPGLLRWTVTATAKNDKAFGGKSSPDCRFATDGNVSEYGAFPAEVVRYSVQRGPTSGHLFFRSLPMNSFVFYFQDFTSLNDLYRLTGCENPYDYPEPGNPGAVRMGDPAHWFQMSSPDGNDVHPMEPYADKVERFAEFGYGRPSVRIPKGTKLVLADTYLYLRPAENTDNVSVSRFYVEMLSDIYKFIHKPPAVYTDWAVSIVPQLVKDVMRPENNSQTMNGLILPRAYVSYEHDDQQLWTLLQLLHPLELYVAKYPEQKDAVELHRRLNDAMPLFFDEEWGGFHNNLAPIDPDMFFTSVYVFNPAIMMADLALLGNENARRMFMGFRDRLLQMGKVCDYVMAEIWLRDFSKQRGYYQGDSTGSFMYLMMAYHNLSGGKDTECLDAAKAAAERLRERCLDICWQVNMTAAGAVACEQLYQATGEEVYRDLAYIPLAGTLKEAWLWECDYGVGEHTTTFWSFSGCPAAPTTAEYETHRTRVLLKDYASLAAGHISPNLRAMLNDAWRLGPTQSRFSLPPVLVAEGADQFMGMDGASQTNCGELRRDQMIPLEDVRGGWGTDLEWWQNNTKLGAVGQEIYGAGGPIWYALWQDLHDTTY